MAIHPSLPCQPFRGSVRRIGKWLQSLTRRAFDQIRRHRHAPSRLVFRLKPLGLLPVGGALKHLFHNGPQGLHGKPLNR